ncbi:unnamed protein product [Cyprideis torosa]|uniref:Uncharacterized protein n=1 Tax=Cyprideis torosa TaxID=163714 RepID=A0A7R8W974_9CRUS|nr:unnamed protein product [Cyprideis torosa]CAG0884082.1 unnamed protein product [Cyprideis torosa]
MANQNPRRPPIQCASLVQSFGYNDLAGSEAVGEICLEVLSRSPNFHLSQRHQADASLVVGLIDRCQEELSARCGLPPLTREVVRDFIISQHIGKAPAFKDPSWNLTQCLKGPFGMGKEDIAGLVDLQGRRDIRQQKSAGVPQERPPHLNPDFVHPAFRQRGQPLQQGHAGMHPGGPNYIPGSPIPGARPTLGGSGQMLPSDSGVNLYNRDMQECIPVVPTTSLVARFQEPDQLWVDLDRCRKLWDARVAWVMFRKSDSAEEEPPMRSPYRRKSSQRPSYVHDFVPPPASAPPPSYYSPPPPSVPQPPKDTPKEETKEKKRRIGTCDQRSDDEDETEDNEIAALRERLAATEAAMGKLMDQIGAMQGIVAEMDEFREFLKMKRLKEQEELRRQGQSDENDRSLEEEDHRSSQNDRVESVSVGYRATSLEEEVPIEVIIPSSEEEEEATGGDDAPLDASRIERGRAPVRVGVSPKHTPRLRKKPKGEKRDDTPQPPPKDDLSDSNATNEDEEPEGLENFSDQLCRNTIGEAMFEATQRLRSPQPPDSTSEEGSLAPSEDSYPFTYTPDVVMKVEDIDSRRGMVLEEEESDGDSKKEL